MGQSELHVRTNVRTVRLVDGSHRPPCAVTASHREPSMTSESVRLLSPIDIRLVPQRVVGLHCAQVWQPQNGQAAAAGHTVATHCCTPTSVATHVVAHTPRSQRSLSHIQRMSLQRNTPRLHRMRRQAHPIAWHRTARHGTARLASKAYGNLTAFRRART